MRSARPSRNGHHVNGTAGPVNRLAALFNTVPDIAAPAVPVTASDRDANGRFTKGNRAAVGRSRKGHHLNGKTEPGNGLTGPLGTVLDGTAPAATVAASDRDGRGRFTKGNRAAVGNPFARRMAKLRSVVLDAVSEDDLRAIAQKLVMQAKDGDAAAAKLLLLYAIGKPAKAVDPDRLDLEEWRLLQDFPTRAEAVRAVLDSQHPAPLAELLLSMLPEEVAAETARLFSKGNRGKDAEEVWELQRRRVRTGK